MKKSPRYINLQKSIREIGKKDKTLMADKVQLNVDENQAICLSKIDFMQKLHIHSHIYTWSHKKQRLKACISFVTGRPGPCNYNMETNFVSPFFFFFGCNTFAALTLLSNFPALVHNAPMSIFSSVTHFFMQSLCFLLVFLLLLLVLLLCFNIFCRSFAFSTNLTFVLLWSVLVNLLRPSPPPGSLHLTAPPAGSLCVRVFFMVLFAFHQSYSLFHISSVCV